MLCVGGIQCRATESMLRGEWVFYEWHNLLNLTLSVNLAGHIEGCKYSCMTPFGLHRTGISFHSGFIGLIYATIDTCSPYAIPPRPHPLRKWSSTCMRSTLWDESARIKVSKIDKNERYSRCNSRGLYICSHQIGSFCSVVYPASIQNLSKH